MKHSIFINKNGYIEVHIVGSVNLSQAIELGKDALRLSMSIEDSGRLIKFLIDSTKWNQKISYPSSMVNRIVSDLRIKKVASFGVSESLLNEQADAFKIGKNKPVSVHFFKTRKEAEEWRRNGFDCCFRSSLRSGSG